MNEDNTSETKDMQEHDTNYNPTCVFNTPQLAAAMALSTCVDIVDASPAEDEYADIIKHNK